MARWREMSAFASLLLVSTAATLDPFSVFQQVCVDGGASFKPGDLRGITKALEPEQREVIKYALFALTENSENTPEVQSSEISGSLFEIAGSGGAVLLVPKANAA